jgi:hypothetical protein
MTRPHDHDQPVFLHGTLPLLVMIQLVVSSLCLLSLFFYLNMTTFLNSHHFSVDPVLFIVPCITYSKEKNI